MLKLNIECLDQSFTQTEVLFWSEFDDLLIFHESIKRGLEGIDMNLLI